MNQNPRIGRNSVGFISWRGMLSAMSNGHEGLSVLGAIARLRKKTQYEMHPRFKHTTFAGAA